MCHRLLTLTRQFRGRMSRRLSARWSRIRVDSSCRMWFCRVSCPRIVQTGTDPLQTPGFATTMPPGYPERAQVVERWREYDGGREGFESATIRLIYWVLFNSLNISAIKRTNHPSGPKLTPRQAQKLTKAPLGSSCATDSTQRCIGFGSDLHGLQRLLPAAHLFNRTSS
jgi:hypothetical protein